MPQQPSSRDLHVDRPLTTISLAYRNAEYIADQIFPVVPVMKQSDKIPKYDQSHWFRNDAKFRAAGEKSHRGGFAVDTSDTYFCERASEGFEVADEQRDNQDAPFDLDRDATEFVTDKVQMKREVNFASNFMTTSVWGTDKDGTANADFTQFSDYGGSSPLTVFTDYKDTVEGKIAREPNLLVLGKQVYSQLKWHPDLVDTIKYTQKGQLTPDLIAALLEVEKLLIGRAIYTTSVEGTAEASVSYTRVWGKSALMLYTPGRPSLLSPAAGYTFVWERVAKAIQYIKRMRDEEREVDIIEANSYFAQKVTGANGGLYMKAVVA
jgi:hypothetical protein